jgi:hypothetical protein
MSPNTTADSNAPKSGEPDDKLPQHHISRILDDALEESSAEAEVPARFKHHPMMIDVALALGLLIAMGGFSAGLFRMYIAHSAEESIAKGNYKAAITLLECAPLPDLFAPPGSEPKEILDRALYLDAIQKLDTSAEAAEAIPETVPDATKEAIKELEKIEPGSRFFELAQVIINEHFKPAPMTVSGQITQEEHLSEKELKARSRQLPALQRYNDE